MGDQVQEQPILSGFLAPKASLIGYFRTYTSASNGSCPPGNFTLNTFGWNGDDHVGIRKNGAWVDMINNPTVANAPRINGVFSGLLKTKIVRQNGNCIRYTSTNPSDTKQLALRIPLPMFWAGLLPAPLEIALIP